MSEWSKNPPTEPGWIGIDMTAPDTNQTAWKCVYCKQVLRKEVEMMLHTCGPRWPERIEPPHE